MKTIISSLILLVFCTNNVYSQWITITSPTSNSLYSVFFTDASTGYISGTTSGIVIKTTNGGTSWIFNNTGSGNSYYDMYFLNALTGFISGSTRQVVKTTNSGTNWDIMTSGSGTLYSISFPSSVAYGVGGSPASFIKSTDFGNNWTTLTAPSTNILRGVYFINGTVGWVCGDYGTIMYTTDGGFSWIPQNQSSSYTFEKLRIHSLTNGFICGSPGIMRTTNSGTNWFSVYSGGYIYDIYFINSITGWGVGSAGKIVKSTDNGNTWLVQSSGVTSTLNAIHMADANTGYIVGSGGILLKTTNGGGVPIVPVFQKIVNSQLNEQGYFGSYDVGDFDNDGFNDILIGQFNDACWTCSYPLSIFRNINGTFTKITTGPIASQLARASGIYWADYDNDGKLDVFVGQQVSTNNFLFHNEGNGNFTKVISGSIVNDGGDSRGNAWADYDKDGWLDLFVCNCINKTNSLFHNNGNGTFTKVTSGTIVNEVGNSRGAAWGDYDNDGWQDLFVTNYQGEKDYLFHNNGNGTFTKILNGPMVNDNKWGTSCSWADYNNDGWLDLCVTNSNDYINLFLNTGFGNFILSSTTPNLEQGTTSNPSWGDYNNDGWLDLFVARGNGGNLLFRNNTQGNFVRITNEELTNENGSAGGFFDYNNNGKLDLIITKYFNGYNSIFNNLGNTGNYITIKLIGCLANTTKSNLNAIGARITIKAGSLSMIREVGSEKPSMLWQHFGLGSTSIIDSIIIKWPSGVINKLSNVAVNQTLLLDECLLAVEKNTKPAVYSLSQNYPNPFNPSTKIEYSLLKSTHVKLIIYDLNGKTINVLVNSNQQPGIYKILIESQDLASGVYFYKLETDDFIDVKKMVVLK